MESSLSLQFSRRVCVKLVLFSSLNASKNSSEKSSGVFFAGRFLTTNSITLIYIECSEYLDNLFLFNYYIINNNYYIIYIIYIYDRCIIDILIDI